MSAIDAFQPMGSTVNISASTSSSSVALSGIGNGGTVRVVNVSDVTIFINFGASDVTAAAATSMPVRANSDVVLTLPPTLTYVAAISASGTTKVIYFTSGQGGI